MPQNRYDVMVVGAGFGGLYALHKLRGLGWNVRVLEAGDDIGGTWYWNRYPGARCDVESMQYSYSFSEEIQQEWNWTELYATQPEILRYIDFVADRLDLRRDIQLSTRVTAASFDEAASEWTLTTAAGERFTAPFVIMATGCLSVPLEPDLPGLAEFRGEVYRTHSWPHHPVDLAGKRIGLIGTGSSGIQATPQLAKLASQLTVFQRTPNYSLPAHNRRLEPEYVRAWKDNYAERRRAAQLTRNNTLNNAGTGPGAGVPAKEREREFERRWQVGGIGFMYAYTDMTTDPEVNAQASEFVRRKIAGLVHDPVTARRLMPKDYGIGGKRICVDTGYFQTFNRPNVTLVDVREDPIQRITAAGVRTASAELRFDVLVLATGFDAMTGAVCRIDFKGRGSTGIRETWRDGPQTYLGMAVAGFPNLFLITGPQSPSVFTNMVTSIEQHVDWIADCMGYMRAWGLRRIEATEAAQEAWVAQTNETGARTLLPTANSWYMGANVPGKPRVILPWLGGAANYARICAEVAAKGYAGFALGD